MNSPSRTTPGLGTWLVVAVCLLLVMAAAIARADGDPSADEGAEETDTAAEGPEEAAPEQVDGEASHPEEGEADPTPSTDADSETERSDRNTGAEAEASADPDADERAEADAMDDAAEPSEAATETDEDDDGEAEGSAEDTTDDACLNAPVLVVRVHGRSREGQRLALTRCDGRPHVGAVDALSILARPHGVDRPTAEDRAAAPGKAFVAPHIRRLHAGLLTRLQALADRWPGRRIEIVSGYRPKARRTSRHHHGRALDLRVAGVSREVVSEFAKTLENTGVGYYPNSVFTHIDVRHRQAYWVDRSGPGERPDYGPWPPKKDERERLRDQILARAFEALDRLAINP
jgi:hypothetical protein